MFNRDQQATGEAETQGRMKLHKLKLTCGITRETEQFMKEVVHCRDSTIHVKWNRYNLDILDFYLRMRRDEPDTSVPDLSGILKTLYSLAKDIHIDRYPSRHQIDRPMLQLSATLTPSSTTTANTGTAAAIGGTSGSGTSLMQTPLLGRSKFKHGETKFHPYRKKTAKGKSK